MPSHSDPRHRVRADGNRETAPLVMRWRSTDDAEAALAVFGEDVVTRRPAPAMAIVPPRASTTRSADNSPDPSGDAAWRPRQATAQHT